MPTGEVIDFCQRIDLKLKQDAPPNWFALKNEMYESFKSPQEKLAILQEENVKIKREKEASDARESVGNQTIQSLERDLEQARAQLALQKSVQSSTSLASQGVQHNVVPAPMIFSHMALKRTNSDLQESTDSRQSDTAEPPKKIPKYNHP